LKIFSFFLLFFFKIWGCVGCLKKAVGFGWFGGLLCGFGVVRFWHKWGDMAHLPAFFGVDSPFCPSRR